MRACPTPQPRTTGTSQPCITTTPQATAAKPLEDASPVLDNKEVLQTLNAAGDDAREVLRVVLQATTPDADPEYVQQLTLQATEKLRSAVFATHIVRQDPLPSYLQEETEPRTEYDRCMAGPLPLTQPSHIYQYLAQRYAVLQAYCLLAPYATATPFKGSSEGTDTPDKCVSEWIALVDCSKTSPEFLEVPPPPNPLHRGSVPRSAVCGGGGPILGGGGNGPVQDDVM